MKHDKVFLSSFIFKPFTIYFFCSLAFHSAKTGIKMNTIINDSFKFRFSQCYAPSVAKGRQSRTNFSLHSSQWTPPFAWSALFSRLNAFAVISPRAHSPQSLQSQHSPIRVHSTLIYCNERDAFSRPSFFSISQIKKPIQTLNHAVIPILFIFLRIFPISVFPGCGRLLESMRWLWLLIIFP